jgi:hypothetical protein
MKLVAPLAALAGATSRSLAAREPTSASSSGPASPSRGLVVTTESYAVVARSLDLRIAARPEEDDATAIRAAFETVTVPETLGQAAVGPDELAVEAVGREALQQALDALAEHERQVLILRFGLDSGTPGPWTRSWQPSGLARAGPPNRAPRPGRSALPGGPRPLGGLRCRLTTARPDTGRRGRAWVRSVSAHPARA